MNYYPYHQIIQKKINNGELFSYEIKNKWKKISPVMLLYFSDNTVFPIRKPKWNEYFDIIKKYEIKTNIKINFEDNRK